MQTLHCKTLFCKQQCNPHVTVVIEDVRLCMEMKTRQAQPLRTTSKRRLPFKTPTRRSRDQNEAGEKPNLWRRSWPTLLRHGGGAPQHHSAITSETGCVQWQRGATQNTGIQISAKGPLFQRGRLCTSIRYTLTRTKDSQSQMTWNPKQQCAT